MTDSHNYNILKRKYSALADDALAMAQELAQTKQMLAEMRRERNLVLEKLLENQPTRGRKKKATRRKTAHANAASIEHLCQFGREPNSNTVCLRFRTNHTGKFCFVRLCLK